MRILAIDVGTGTQDILLFDSAQPIENAFQLIMPSPTQIAAGRIRRATEAGRAVAISGTIAGGGPCHWALEDHLRANLPAYATHDAAMTFDDDLDAVQRMGVTLVSDDEIARLDADHVTLRDLDLDAIRTALAAFDVSRDFDGLALGCLDHGAAPPGYSDRLFRFEHLRRIVETRNDLRAFACLPEEVPDYLTRARSLLASVDVDAPVVFLDTGPAAALGALQDPAVGEREDQVVLNLGNMHALCFHLRGTRIVSLYEHHTGEVTAAQIEDFTERLIAGTLLHEDVFDSKGHGVYYAANPVGAQHASPADNATPRSAAPSTVSNAAPLPLIAVTGPQRGKLRGSRLNPYFAVPHGDMMVSGCFGLLWAFAEKHPQFAGDILPALALPRSS
jgi:uncharacterized protein (DUF1786 family)